MKLFVFVIDSLVIIHREINLNPFSKAIFSNINRMCLSTVVDPLAPLIAGEGGAVDSSSRWSSRNVAGERGAVDRRRTRSSRKHKEDQ